MCVQNMCIKKENSVRCIHILQFINNPLWIINKKEIGVQSLKSSQLPNQPQDDSEKKNINIIYT